VTNRRGRARPASSTRRGGRYPPATGERARRAGRLALYVVAVIVGALLLALLVQLPSWVFIAVDFVLFTGVMTVLLLLTCGRQR